MAAYSHRKSWTSAEVKAFLACYIARKEEFTHSRKKIYAYGNVLRDLLEKKAITPDTSVIHLATKMKSLIKTYRGETCDGLFPMNAKPSFQYMAELDEIFKNRSILSINPKMKRVESKSSTKRTDKPSISSQNSTPTPIAPSSYPNLAGLCGYCRVCCLQFNHDTPKHSLFNDNDKNNRTTIGDMFVEYLFKELAPNNGFFDHLCSECSTKLKDFHAFRCQAIDASKKMNELRDNGNRYTDPLCDIIKIEDEQEFDDEQRTVDTPNPINFIKVEGLSVQEDFGSENDISKEMVDDTTVPDTEQSKTDSVTQSNLFNCSSCNKHYKAYRDFRNHNLEVHSKCEICNTQLNGPHVLKIHMDRVHGELQCRFCGETYFTAISLERHEARHSSSMLNHVPFLRRMQIEKKSECKICRRKLVGPASLKIHMDRIHKELICRHCGEKLYTTGALDRHEARHSDERPFACHLCEKCFATADSLRVHHQGHLNNRRYVCEICGLKFRSRSHVEAHLGTHHPGKYKCEFCDKTFKRKNGQRMHREKIHLKMNLLQCSLCDRLVHILKRRTHVLYHKQKGEDAAMQRVPDQRPLNL